MVLRRSGGVHLLSLTLGQHSSEETLHRWRAVGGTVLDLTDLGIKPQTARTDSNVLATKLTSVMIFYGFADFSPQFEPHMQKESKIYLSKHIVAVLKWELPAATWMNVHQMLVICSPSSLESVEKNTGQIMWNRCH